MLIREEQSQKKITTNITLPRKLQAINKKRQQVLINNTTRGKLQLDNDEEKM